MVHWTQNPSSGDAHMWHVLQQTMVTLNITIENVKMEILARFKSPSKIL